MHNVMPSAVDPSRVISRVGIISDTHMPERCSRLPAAVTGIFGNVDLILHAGDVGKLWVLDQLSAMAPAVAVHGNDETEEAQRELPYQQIVCIEGKRILLCHSHFPDKDREMQSRKVDGWHPKLTRRIDQAKRAEARVFVFGHSHVPMTYASDGILLVNPGAIASGNAFTRQVVQTVALLFIIDDGTAEVVHIDLSQPDRYHEPQINWEAGFQHAASRYSASILAPDLAERIEGIKMARFSRRDSIKNAVLRLSRRCWSGRQRCFSRQELLDEIGSDPDIPESDRQVAGEILA